MKINEIKQLYQLLFRRFGHRNWWPAETPLEVCVGAILTQNTAWKNVKKAIENMLKADLLSLNALAGVSHEKLAETIRPAGYYNIKAKRLNNFIQMVVSEYECSLDLLFDTDLAELRTKLLSVNGIGKETADSIILYAAEKPIFVIDAYTKRILARRQLISPTEEYDQVQALFHNSLDRDVDLYKDFHAQFVAVGHHYCRPNPKCDDCPLNRFNEYKPEP